MSIDSKEIVVEFTDQEALKELELSFRKEQTGYIMYSLEKCPFCEKAEELIDEDGFNVFISFKEGFDFFDKELIKKNVSKLVNKKVTTFPIIFTVDMQFIGGYDDLEHFLHKKELKYIIGN